MDDCITSDLYYNYVHLLVSFGRFPVKSGSRSTEKLSKKKTAVQYSLIGRYLEVTARVLVDVHVTVGGRRRLFVVVLCKNASAK